MPASTASWHVRMFSKNERHKRAHKCLSKNVYIMQIKFLYWFIIFVIIFGSKLKYRKIGINVRKKPFKGKKKSGKTFSTTIIFHFRFSVIFFFCTI